MATSVHFRLQSKKDLLTPTTNDLVTAGVPPRYIDSVKDLLRTQPPLSPLSCLDDAVIIGLSEWLSRKCADNAAFYKWLFHFVFASRVAGPKYDEGAGERKNPSSRWPTVGGDRIWQELYIAHHRSQHGIWSKKRKVVCGKGITTKFRYWFYTLEFELKIKNLRHRATPLTPLLVSAFFETLK